MLITTSGTKRQVLAMPLWGDCAGLLTASRSAQIAEYYPPVAAYRCTQYTQENMSHISQAGPTNAAQKRLQVRIAPYCSVMRS